MRCLRDCPILYLDFDGVLHPLGEPELDDNFKLLPNPRRFLWLPILEGVLQPYKRVRIIVSSDWARIFDDNALIKLLGPLGPRFVGVVETRAGSRREDITADAQKRGLEYWVAIDDDASVKQRREEHFVWCNPATGLSDGAVREKLHERIRKVSRSAGLSLMTAASERMRLYTKEIEELGLPIDTAWDRMPDVGLEVVDVPPPPQPWKRKKK